MIGGLGAVATFLASFSNNILTTTLLRSLYSFVILFALVFVFRWILGILLAEPSSETGQPSTPEEPARGQTIDLTTPDEPIAKSGDSSPSGRQSTEQEEDDGFAPLNPPKLATKDQVNSEELVKALRHLSEE